MYILLCTSFLITSLHKTITYHKQQNLGLSAKKLIWKKKVWRIHRELRVYMYNIRLIFGEVWQKSTIYQTYQTYSPSNLVTYSSSISTYVLIISAVYHRHLFWRMLKRTYTQVHDLLCTMSLAEKSSIVIGELLAKMIRGTVLFISVKPFKFIT